MLHILAKRLFGSVNDRTVQKLQSDVDKINAYEPDMEKKSDEQLLGQTKRLKERLAAGETLDDILHEAFATVREAARRTLGQRHYDVQLMGGVALHQGKISEMRTGEGKTLVSTLPVYLNALSGKGVHVVTVNDYLAKRDANWMGQVYNFLGLSVGCIVHDLRDDMRRQAYASDITYGTNNEFGFDYLRDNMKFRIEDRVQRDFNYAIVDEVDSILVDEARTPLIISGPSEISSTLYSAMDKVVKELHEEDYTKDEKARTIILTEDGISRVELLLKRHQLISEEGNLYDMEFMHLLHHVDQALKAQKLFARDVDYMVKDNQVMIIDEFTGRVMEGRRYSEGLHQAIEAKENVPIQQENQTLASITFQNYFRLFPKLAGMTGTAATEEAEFRDIYGLEVVVLPTHLPVERQDEDDVIYRTAEEKYDAIIATLLEAHEKGQPILVGTVSIEKSESISSILKKRKIKHHVLNAKYHEQEAQIIAQAGRFKAVTIATNMAGRGTDIMLGGNPDMLLKEAMGKEGDKVGDVAALKKKIEAQVTEEKQKVKNAGGLFVIGTERHESRRIDNQLRGRSGRQGDPGRTQFFLSLEDDLMRIFGSDRISGLLQKLGLKDGEAIHHPMISRTLEKAQSKVEARNYEIRKTLLKFDDVMNDQRKVIYEQRVMIMESEDVKDIVEDMRTQLNEEMVSMYIPEKAYADQWKVDALEVDAKRVYGIDIPVTEWAKEEGIADQEIVKRLNDLTVKITQAKEAQYGEGVMRSAEKQFLLMTLDQLWKEHLLGLDHLRQGISLRAYGQKDPLNEYKREAFSLFETMMLTLRENVVSGLSHIVIRMEDSDGKVREYQRPSTLENYQETRQDPAHAAQPREMDSSLGSTYEGKKVGRNEPCPCGSAKKFKQCHGKLA